MKSNIMGVLLNGIAQLEYDRGKPLPDAQSVYLDRMDAKMGEGIMVDEEWVADPDLTQRAQFVAANLAHAIKTNDETQAAALCTYLANRLPDLQQVKIDDADDEISIEMVFDEQYRRQVAVPFPRFH